MTDLTLSVRLTAEGDALVGAVRVSRDELAKLSKAATDATKSQEGAARGMGDVGRTAENAGRQLRGMHGAVEGLRTRVTQLVAAWLSFEAVKSVLGGVVRETTNAERIGARLDAVLRATGNAAGFTREQLDELAESMARRTLFDDETIRQGIAVMATFKSVTGDTFREAIEQSANLAALLGGDLQSAILQVGKALEEPELGLTMLRRLGVSFTESQREMILQLNATGRAAEAQGVILAALAGQLGGVAGAQNTGLVGSITTLTKAWDDLLESFGRTPLVQKVIAKVTRDWTEAFNELRGVIESFSGGGAGGGSRPPAAPVELGQKQRDVLRSLQEQSSLLGRSAVEAEQFKALRAAGFEPTLGAGGVTVKDLEKLPQAFQDAVKKILGDVALVGRAGFGEQTRGIQRGIDTADELRIGRALGPDARAEIVGRRTALDFAAQNKITDAEQINLLQKLFTAQERANRELQLTEELYDRLRGPQERYAERLRTIQREHASGGISAEEMRRVTREAYLDMLEASREWEDGVKRGVVKVLDEAGDAARGFEDLTVGSFRRGEDAVVQFVRTGKLATGDLFSFIEEQLIRMAYRAFILKPFLEPFEQVLTSTAKSLFAGGGGGVDASNELVALAHGGGQAGGPNAFRPVAVPASVFADAPRFQRGGPIGPGERPIIAHDGEVIGWPEQLRRAFGSNVSIEIIDQRGQGAPPIEATTERGPDGREIIRVLVRREMSQGFDDGVMDSALQRNYGMARVPQTRRS